MERGYGTLPSFLIQFLKTHFKNSFPLGGL